jgi:hypothetical protein
MLKKYDFRKDSEIKKNTYYNENTYDLSHSNIEKDMFELKPNIPKYNFNVTDINKIKDYKLPPLKKKYSRPYFSPKFNSWEMDFMIVPFAGKSPFISTESHNFLFYLFMININTKYLCVSESHNKDTSSVVNLLNKMLNEGIEIDNIRGDADSAFQDQLIQELERNGINYYFTPHVYTNRNRVVDRVMRTIRDMFDQIGYRASLYDVKLMQQLVDKYNHTTHAAFNYRFTPAQVQNNKQLERIFIYDKKSKLDDVPKNFYLNNYKLNDLILVHVPFSKINYKRRRNFTHLASFIQYIHGNVECKLVYPDDEYSGDVVVIPIYYTKPYSAIDENVANYFNFIKNTKFKIKNKK